VLYIAFLSSFPLPFGPSGLSLLGSGFSASWAIPGLRARKTPLDYFLSTTSAGKVYLTLLARSGISGARIELLGQLVTHNWDTLCGGIIHFLPLCDCYLLIEIMAIVALAQAGVNAFILEISACSRLPWFT